MVTLALGTVNILLGADLININGSYHFILNSFGGFLGFMLLGSYLRNHTARRTIKRNVIVPLGIIFGLLLAAVIGYKLRIVTADLFLENLSLPTGLLVYSVFMLIKDVRVDNKFIRRIISEIAVCSYGIYLIHIFVARGLVWKIMEYAGLGTAHAALQALISLLLSLSVSYTAIRLIKLLPFSKYIVG